MEKQIRYPNRCPVPGTTYTLEALYGDEFRMGYSWCALRVLGPCGNPHIDLSNWKCCFGVYASDFVRQSSNNPGVLILPVLITQSVHSQKTRFQHNLYTLKLNMEAKTFRVSDEDESDSDLDRTFYPIGEMDGFREALSGNGSS